MPLINLMALYLVRKYGVPLHIFFSKNGPEVQATLMKALFDHFAFSVGSTFMNN